mgnify:CR=1 FL=1
MDKPFSPSSERNREPILRCIGPLLADRRRVLEIGSGTGQHAVHFAAALPHLSWQCADLRENLQGIRAWLDDAALPNTPPPLALDVEQVRWPAGGYDAIYTANTLHIMSWAQVQTLFRRLPEMLLPGALLIVYGPFNDAGVYSSPSNAAFDARLKSDDPRRGIRDAQAVDALATESGLSLMADHPMPANNRCRVWQHRNPSPRGA